MAGRVVYFNGRFVPEAEARVSIFDSALMYGDMAFEMTRTYGHRPFRLREHLDRLYGSLRLLEIDCGLSIEAMERVTLETLERNLATEPADMDWQIMHDVSRGPLELYRTAFPGGIGPTVSINCWPLVTHMGRFAPNYRSGVHLMIPAQQAVPAHLVDPKAKTRSRLHYQLANLQAGRAGAGRWPVLLDPDGFLAEGPGWNIFLVRDGVLVTPEPRNILLGVSRNATMEYARGLGIPVREANATRRCGPTRSSARPRPTRSCMPRRSRGNASATADRDRCFAACSRRGRPPPASTSSPRPRATPRAWMNGSAGRRPRPRAREPGATSVPPSGRIGSDGAS